MRRVRLVVETFGRDVPPLPTDDNDPSPDLSDLDTIGISWTGKQMSMRWVLIHMLSEVARHDGHLDVLRELIDGAAGDHDR